MIKLSTTLAASTIAGLGFITNPEEAQAQQRTSILDRLPVNITHCIDVETAPVDELIGLRVHYQTDACRINGDHLQAIESAIALARSQNPGQAIHAFVLGETDPRASDSYNQRLGMQRANGLVRALESRGVTVQRVASIGESRTPQEIRNNPTARNAFAFLGTVAQIAACAQNDKCVANTVVASSLRHDR